ncbi:MAG: peptidase M23 [Acidobacterium sp.]|nr:M23 family metallopeptidase [Acidobacteriota bacterium]PHY10916.1 MAG: peptidase M23 [Acidobacterium sp.]
MFSKRYTIVFADRTTGVVRRFAISVKAAATVVVIATCVPMLVGVGAAFKAKYDVAQLYASHATLELENANYRAATETLAGQIVALQTTMSDLGAKAALDPRLQNSMDKLPTVVKNRAMGGPTASAALTTVMPGLASPETTFSVLKDLLQSLESRLQTVRSNVDKRNSLAAATPSIWPTHGWLSSSMGNRADPLTGERDFHPGLDISADKGDPVYATADGKVSSAAMAGNYGNLVIIDHGYGIETRYGHLSAFKVRDGQAVKRGDLLGLVGATGRTTGSHLHYEVRANGRILNPLQLLLTPRRATGN